MTAKHPQSSETLFWFLLETWKKPEWFSPSLTVTDWFKVPTKTPVDHAAMTVNRFKPLLTVRLKRLYLGLLFANSCNDFSTAAPLVVPLVADVETGNRQKLHHSCPQTSSYPLVLLSAESDGYSEI